MQFNSKIDILELARSSGLIVLDDCEFKNTDDFYEFLNGFGTIMPFAYTSTNSEDVSVVNNQHNIMPQAGCLWNEKPSGDWHIDTVFTTEYPEFGVLYSKVVPEGLGATWFADSRLAVKDLSTDYLKFLRTLKVIHYRQPNKRYTQASWEQQYSVPSKEKLDTAFQHATRPLIMSDYAGNEYIMLSPSKAVRFEGWTEDESRGIIEFLAKHITRPEYIKQHVWKNNQLVIWINNVMNHYGVYDYHGSTRELWRAYLK